MKAAPTPPAAAPTGPTAVARPSTPGGAAPRLTGLPAVADSGARILILGSFPGAASLAAGQYYAHPRNQFWPLLSSLWGIDLRALGYAGRLDALRQRGVALWDVHAACRRHGSLDRAIEDAEPNDLLGLVARLPLLRGIAHNGGESARAMRVTLAFSLPVLRLPSTSPANASWTLERKRAAWAQALALCGVEIRSGPAP
jgi:hypoxanthine-DNA glycosylase